MSHPNREPYFWHFNRKVLSAAALGLREATSHWWNHVPQTQRSGWCPVNITVPIFTSFFICTWYKTMKSWPYWCQWQKLDTVGAGQVFAQRPQSSSPGVTFVLVLSPGLPPSSKTISEFSKSSPLRQVSFISSNFSRMQPYAQKLAQVCARRLSSGW